MIITSKNVQIDHQVVQNTLQFLGRATLQGGEVPAFAACVNWLSSLLEQPQKSVSDDSAAEE